MKLEYFHIRNCFGFVDSGEINLSHPGSLIYFLGKNSSGKTSVLRAISNFEHGEVPRDHPNFQNYEAPEEPSLLRAHFSMDPSGAWPLSANNLIDGVIQPLGSTMVELAQDDGEFSTTQTSRSAPAAVELLNHVREVYSDLIERIQQQGHVWIEKLADGSYRFLTEEEDYEDFNQRQESIYSRVNALNTAFSQDGWQYSQGITFEYIEGQLFKQFPEIFVFTNRFSLDEDLPRSIRDEHLSNQQNSLTEAFMDLLDQKTLGDFLRATGRRRTDELNNGLQTKLDELCTKINEDASTKAADELVQFYVDRKDDVRVILEVEGKETYYEHLSDNTKFLIAYYIFQEDRERKNYLNSILLFDEPNQGFHPSAEGKMLRFLESLAEQGNQILITTHSQHMIDFDRLPAIRIMGQAEDRTLLVSNSIYRLASQGGDILALQPVTEAIGLHYSQQLAIQDKIIVTEGYTDMLYLRAFKRILGHSADLNIAPLRGDSQIAQFVPFLISQGASFKVVLDSEARKKDVQKDYPIPDKFFFVVPIPAGIAPKYGAGIEDLFTKANFAAMLSRYGWSINHQKHNNVANSNYAKQERVKADLATKLYSDQTLNHSDFEQGTLDSFKSVLDFCAANTWFRS